MRAFYRDVVGLEPDEVGEGSFKLGPAGTFFVVDHSEVSGPTKERSRVMIDLHVADIDAEQGRMGPRA
jgi:catechol-2,3-dioxygenase